MTGVSEHPHDSMRDEELARDAATGSSRAFETLVTRYEARLFRYARHWGLSADEAEDATQEAFLSAWRSLGRYDPRRPFGAWLFTILSRRASGVSRARQSRLRLIGRARDLGGGAKTDMARDRDDGRIWSVALADLGPEASGALWLRYVEDLSPKEIGRVLGKSGGAVRVMLHRARQRLVESLDEETLASLAGSQQCESAKEASQGRRARYAECGT